MKRHIENFAIEMNALLRDEQGLSVTEYAVAGGLVAAVAATAFTTLGNNIKTAISGIATTVAG
jgi:pilus assembly protein Flp/PilA